MASGWKFVPLSETEEEEERYRFVPLSESAPEQEGAFARASRVFSDPEGGTLPAIGSLIASALPSGGGERSAGGFAADTATDVARGVVGLGQSVVGLGNLVTFGALGKGLEAVGYSGEQTQQFLSGLYTEDRKAAQQNVEEAKGFVDTVKALAVNPSELIGTVVQAVPQTIGAGAAGGAIVRQLLPQATKAAAASGLTGEAATKFVADYVTKRAAVAASASEGALTAGSIAESGREAGQDFSTFAPAALAGGVTTALIGRASGAVGRKLGIGDLETDIAARGAGLSPIGTAGGLIGRVTKEGFKEGVLEEAPQSFQEELFTQLAKGEELDFQKAGSAAAMGLGAGGVMGGANAAVSRQRQPDQLPPPPPPPAPSAQADLDTAVADLQSAVDPYVGIKQATTVDAAIEAAARAAAAPVPDPTLDQRILVAESPGLVARQLEIQRQLDEQAGLTLSPTPLRNTLPQSLEAGISAVAPLAGTPDLQLGQAQRAVDREAQLLEQRDGTPANTVPERLRLDAQRREEAAGLIESNPQATGAILDRANLLRAEAQGLRTRADEIATTSAASAQPGAGTQFERDQLDAQAAVNREMRLPAQEGPAARYADTTPMTPLQARQRLAVMQDQNGQPLSLEIAPHPTQKGSFAIARRELPAASDLDLAAPAPTPVSAAEAQNRLESAELGGREQRRKRLDEARQIVVTRALKNVEERGGVASPQEAQIFQGANLGRPYDSIDENLAPKPGLVLPRMEMRGPEITPSGIVIADGGSRQTDATRDSRLQRLDGSMPGTEAAQAGMRAFMQGDKASPLAGTLNVNLAGQTGATDEQNATLLGEPRDPGTDLAKQRVAAGYQAPPAAPRPQKVGGTAVAQLASAQLTQMAADENLPAITRRGAQIELGYRASEADATAASAPLAPPPQENQVPQSDLSGLEVGGAPAAEEATARLEAAAAQGRALSQPTAGRIITSTAKLSTPRAQVPGSQHTLQDQGVDHNYTVVEPARLGGQGKLLAQVSRIFGKKLVVFESDTLQADGFVQDDDSSTVYVNAKSSVSPLAVFGHELTHLIKRDNAAAYSALEAVVKRNLAPEGMAKFEADYGVGANLEELASDLTGNRFQEPQFWSDVFGEIAAANPEQSRSIITRLAGALNKAVNAFLKAVRQPGFKADQYVKDLEAVKAAVKSAVVKYAQQQREPAMRMEAELMRAESQVNLSAGSSAPANDSQADIAASPARNAQVDTPEVGEEGSGISRSASRGRGYDVNADEGEGRGRAVDTAGARGVPADAGQDRPAPGRDGGRAAPSYGTAREGAISVVARHYSREPRQSLSGAFFGTGLKGAERGRLASSSDPRVRSRVYFYVDNGKGIRPESGVGGIAHEVQLNNIYDPATRLIPPQPNANSFESAVLNAGFDGYIDRQFTTQQGAVVLLGPKHANVPVRQLGQVTAAAAPAPAVASTLKRGLMSRELSEINPANIPGARVRMGNLEIPSDQVAVANTELERIGSTARFSPARQRLVDTASLDETLKLAQSRAWPRGRELKVAMQQKVLDAAIAAGLDPSKDNAQTREYLSEIGMRDALIALKQNPNAIGWYDRKTRQALAVMALVHPEIARDENARFAFTWALAVTSNGLKVDKNFELAEQAYVAYKSGGKMPTTIGIGTARGQIDDALGLFNELRDAWGMDNLRKFMQTNFAVSEITGISKALTPGGEHADVAVKGAAILGPKIGNGFFSNLYGDFASLTMDRWLIRTWGRWTGTLIKPMPEQTTKARSRLIAGIRAIADKPAEAKRLGDLLGVEITGQTDADGLAAAVQKASMDPDVRSKLNQSDVGLELRKAGNSLAKYLDGQKEAPANPDERKFIRAVFGDLLSGLRQTPKYKDLTMADLQAVLWYAEKRLYETSKEDPQELAADEDVAGYADEEAPDYANAAASVARKKGVTDRRINATLRNIQNERSGTTESAVGASAAPGQAAGAGQPAAAGGFTRQERQRFVGERAVLRARADRAGDAGQPGAYSGDGGADGGRVRVLKSLGVTYTQQWKATRDFGTVSRANNLATPEFIELASTPENAAKFQDAISKNKESLKFGAAVYVYPAEDYQTMRLLLTKDGKSGVAIKPDGDIVSVFSTSGAGRALMELAVSAGGRKLDAFDTILPQFYAPHGFRTVARTRWNDDFAPDNWDKDTFRDFNNGEPDVVFMVYDPAKTDAEYSRKDGRVMTGEDGYDRAVAAQSREMRKIGRTTPGAQLSRTRERQAADIPVSELKGRKVALQVRIEDTGETGTLTMDAADSLTDIDERESAMQRLLECLRK